MGYKVNKIRVGTKQVRPSGWKPGSNTLAYYPLTSTTTVNDMSGNGKNLTNSGVTFGTYKGVDCAYFSNNSSNYLRNTSFNTGLQVATVLIRCYFISNGVKYNGNYNEQLLVRGPKIQYRTSGFEGAVDSLRPTDYVMQSDKERILTARVMDFANDIDYAYINGTLSRTFSDTSDISNNITIGNNSAAPNYQNCNWIGGISEVIIENKARTAQEILNYYNQTKSKYGL